MRTDLLINVTEQQKQLFDIGVPPVSLSICWYCKGIIPTEEHLKLVAALFDIHENFKVQLEHRSDVRYPIQKIATENLLVIKQDKAADYVSYKDHCNKEYAQQYHDKPLLSIDAVESGSIIYLQLPAYTADTHTLLKIGTAIQGILNDSASELEPVVEYSQYVTWQEGLAEEMPEEVKKWQTKQLREHLHKTALPFEYKKGMGSSYKTSQSFEIPQAAHSLIKELSEKNNVTASVIWQSIFACLLHHVTDADEIIFNSLLNGRVYDELDNTLGLIDQFVPVKVDFLNTESLSELINMIDAVCKDIHSVAEYFSIDFLHSRGALDRAYTIQHIELPENISEDISVHALDPYSILQLNIVDGDITKIYWTYNTDFFDEPTIHVLSDLLQRIVQTLYTDSDSILKKEIFSGPTTLNIDLNENILPDFITLFDDQCISTPQATALIYNDQEYTYTELKTSAELIARQLVSKYKIESGDIIGICCNRSADVIMTLIAILKTGAAFLPIDHTLPIKRIQNIVADAKPKLVIADSAIENVGNVTDIETLQQGESYNVSLPEISPDQLAYIIYTSGTTGKPKGCMLTRANLSHYIDWCKTAYFKDNNLGNFGWFTPLSFDLTITSIFSPLATGKCVTVLDNKLSIDEVLKECFSNSKIDIIKLTPSHINLLKTLNVNNSSIKAIITGGEALLEHHVEALFDIDSDLEIYNEYGPTEATVGCVVKKLTSKDDKITIGAAINRMQAVVVGDEGENLMPGISGELWLTGAGLAKGYLYNEALTSEKFIKPSWSGGNVFYKTGDIVRVLPNGEIDYLGRIDKQVKIRGYRIELQEIVHCLKSVDGLSEVHVCLTAIEDEKELVAFYTSKIEISVEVITAKLKDILPEYMIPASLFRVSSMPLTVNGKVDEQLLLSHELTIKQETVYEAPANDTERRLADIWIEVLHADEVSRHDDFFKCGGQSIKAAQLVSRIRKQFGADLKLRDVFDHSILSEQAILIQHSDNVIQDNPVILPLQEDYEVSGAQWRIWTAHNMIDLSTAYNMPSAHLITGTFNNDVFYKAFELLIEKFEVLRTHFVLKDDKLRQIITDIKEFRCEEEDLSAEELTEEEIGVICSEHASKHIALDSCPLYRAKLIKLSNDKWLFLLNIHHILIDGLSERILLEQLITNYKSLLNGDELGLQVNPYQYKEYAAWQNKQEEKYLQSESRNYWLKKLAGELPVLKLIAPSKSKANRKYISANTVYKFGEIFTKSIKQYALENSVSDFTVLLAAVNVLLHKYSGQTDILLGVPVDNRLHEYFEHQAGIFLNTILLRNMVDTKDSVSHLLGDIRETLVEGMNHAHYPYELLARELNEHSNNDNLFQVLVNLQEREFADGFELDGTNFRKLRSGSTNSKVDLAFNFSIVNELLQLELDYSTDLYSDVFIQQLLNHLHRILETVITDDRIKVSKLSVLSNDESNYLIAIGRGEGASIDRAKTIYSSFAATALEFSDKTAIVSGEVKLTYGELQERIASYANYFAKDLKIKKSEVVPVLASRNIDTVVYMLALMSIGAVYLPVDASYPKKRIELILSASKCTQILNASGNDIQLEGYDVIKMSSEPLKEVHAHISYVSGDDGAYMIYTSGSTGVPKGLMITHMGFVNMIQSQISGFGIRYNDNCLWFASPSFDASLSEIFLALHTGATLYIADQEQIQNQVVFADWLSNKSITVATIPPAYLATCPDISTLKVLISAGEPLPLMVAKKYAGKCRLFNAYGPSENAVCTTYYEVKGNELEVPIGKPIHNVQIKVVDTEGELVPLGVEGELHIAGPGLAKGYTDVELTKKFFYKEGNTIWYRTGDKVIWSFEEQLIFTGRADQQLKIRGNRVELGDIKSYLSSLDNIADTVLVFDDFGSGYFKLVAYVVTDKNGADEEQLKYMCRIGLPNYMIPDYILFIDSIPLTENGKTAYSKLPMPSSERLDDSKQALTSEETQIIDVLQEELKGNFNSETNFFNVGGNSLLAIKLISGIYKLTGVSLSFGDVYQYPVVSDLAKLIVSKESKAEKDTIVSSDNIWIPATPMQQKIWADAELDNGEKYLMTGVYTIKGSLNESSFIDAMYNTIIEHEAFRSRFEVGTDGLVYTVIDEADEQVQFFDEVPQGQIADQYTHELLSETIDVRSDALCKMILVKQSNEEWTFGCMLHHLIGDAWTMKLLLTSVFEKYHNQKEKREVLGYSSFASTLNKVVPKNIDRHHLSDISLHKETQGRSRDTGFAEVLFTQDTLTHLRQIAASHSISLLSVISSIQSVSLMSFTGQEELAVFTPLHGRYNVEWQDIAGLFMNVIALEVNTSKGSINDILSDVQQQYQRLIDTENIDEYVAQWVPSGSEMKDGRALVEIQVDDYDLHYEAVREISTGLNVSSALTNGKGMVRKFDLEFHYQVMEDRLIVQCLYDTGLFTGKTVESYVYRIEQIITRLIETPELRLEELLSILQKESKDKTQNAQQNSIKDFFKQK